MNTIIQLFDQAELAEAAYVNFWDETTSSLISDKEYVQIALENQGLSKTQAADFVTHWKVIAQCPNTDSGFSATVFERLDGDNAGERYIAVRGTEPTAIFTDWETNIGDIGADGIAISQAIDMYNWYIRLISPAETPYSQYKYHEEATDGLGNITTPAWIEEYAEVSGNTGALYFGSEPTTVIGHSLGGHLAIILSRLIPNITSATTFNAPGFDTQILVDLTEIGGGIIYPKLNPLTSEGFLDLLRGIAGSEIGKDWTASMDNFMIPGDKVSQIGTVPEGQADIFSEAADTNPYSAHLMPAITDALAVYDLLAQIDTDLTLDSITGILKASSNIGEYSLESAVSALGVLFVSGFNKRTGSEYNTNRDDLYKDIDEIEGIVAKLPDTPKQTVKSLCTTDAEGKFIPLSASEINGLAHDDSASIAYRYALKNLNPFVLIGVDYETKFNQDGELDVYSSDTSNGQLSDKYLEDRANFLVQLLYENINDTGAKNPYDPINIDVYPNLPSYYYADLATGKQSLNAVYSDLAAKKDNYQQFIFGSNEGDPEIVGGSKGDHLYDSSPKAFSPHRAVFEIAA